MAFNRFATANELVDAGLLSRRELVEERIQITDLSGRNNLFQIAIGNDRKLVFKEAGTPDAERRQAIKRDISCRQLAQKDPVLKNLLPRVLHNDPNLGYFVQPHFDGESAVTIFKQDPDMAKKLAKALGSSLASIHQGFLNFPEQIREEPFTNRLPWIFRQFTGKAIDRFVPRSGGQARLLALLKSHPEIPEQLAAVSELWEGQGLINGDAKLPNIVWQADGDYVRTAFLDWELAGTGDFAWDLAGLVQSFISELAWNPKQNRDSVFELCSIMCFTYRHTLFTNDFNAKLPAERVLRFTGPRLIQTAFESVHNRDRLIDGTVRLIQAGLNLMESPSNQTDLIDREVARNI